ncbi:serine threonine protein kinase [Stylonychia lemnae]|uniref:Serine threonine protein kinase n=1 Tax=Stylonychia lemnae TaxID=5949 RepID=A0A078AS97_STYLE|nr:serine threonine protein kinase [Stylonychia lemnae]|eukprot:CDW84087.1 serine threonine protein kinase [Stylonychia lemnae]
MTKIYTQSRIFEEAFPQDLIFREPDANFIPFTKEQIKSLLVNKFQINCPQIEINSKQKYRAILDRNIIYLFLRADKKMLDPQFCLDIEFSTLFVNYFDDDVKNTGTLHSLTIRKKDRVIQFVPCHNSNYEIRDNIILQWANALSKFTISEDILSRYKIIDKLGQGANSTVYKVSSKVNPKKFFALKVINKMSFENNCRVDQLVSEIRINRNLSDCPGVIKIFEVSETKVNIYLLLEFKSGGSLQDILQSREWGYEEKKIRSIAEQILNILTEIHQRQIIHRDLKPDNILIEGEKNGSPKVFIADFGLASELGDSSKIKVRCGTPGFAAPEIISGKQQTQKADIFSFGALLFYMFTGSNLIKGNSIQQILLRTTRLNSKERLQKLSCSPAALDFISQTLIIDPINRPTGEDLLQHHWLKRIKIIDITQQQIEFKPNELVAFGQLKISNNSFVNQRKLINDCNKSAIDQNDNNLHQDLLRIRSSSNRQNLNKNLANSSKCVKRNHRIGNIIKEEHEKAQIGLNKIRETSAPMSVKNNPYKQNNHYFLEKQICLSFIEDDITEKLQQDDNCKKFETNFNSQEMIETIPSEIYDIEITPNLNQGQIKIGICKDKEMVDQREKQILMSVLNQPKLQRIFADNKY